MATWHPPIPAAKLYSEPALKLGPALAMLIWCYDGIQRDGTIEIRLESVQQELNVSYRTIKEWWKLLKAGPFFCELIDKGKKGWVVRMADDWVDWHVMSNNYPRQGRNSALEEENTSSSRPDEGQESALDAAQGPVKARSRPDEGRNSALEEPAYKEDHHDQESERVGGNSKHAPPHSPFVLAYFSTYPSETLSADQIDEIDKRITDLKRWKQALRYWSTNGHRSRSIGKICDRYDEEGTQNGHRPAGRAPPVAAQPWKPAEGALSGAALQEAIAARTKKRE